MKQRGEIESKSKGKIKSEHCKLTKALYVSNFLLQVNNILRPVAKFLNVCRCLTSIEISIRHIL